MMWCGMLWAVCFDVSVCVSIYVCALFLVYCVMIVWYVLCVFVLLRVVVKCVCVCSLQFLVWCCMVWFSV